MPDMDLKNAAEYALQHGECSFTYKFAGISGAEREEELERLLATVELGGFEVQLRINPAAPRIFDIYFNGYKSKTSLSEDKKVSEDEVAVRLIAIQS
jgi:hypothetical protein